MKIQLVLSLLASTLLAACGSGSGKNPRAPRVGSETPTASPVPETTVRPTPAPGGSMGGEQGTLGILPTVVPTAEPAPTAEPMPLSLRSPAAARLTRSVAEGEGLSFRIQETDARISLECQLVTGGACPTYATRGLVYLPSEGNLSWKTDSASSGSYRLTFRAPSEVAPQEVTIIVFVRDALNTAPEIDSLKCGGSEEARCAAVVGETLSLQVASSDRDFDLTSTLVSCTPALAWNPTGRQGVFTLAPTTAEVGEHTCAVEVRDSFEPYASVRKPFVVNVSQAPNRAPELRAPTETISVVAGQDVHFKLSASDDRDGERLVFASHCDSCSTSGSVASDGTFRWTTAEADIGEHTFLFEVRDTEGLTASASVRIRVEPPPATGEQTAARFEGYATSADLSGSEKDMVELLASAVGASSIGDASRKLTSLTVLELRNRALPTLKPLAFLPALSFLDLSGSTIVDAESLAVLTQLKSLSLKGAKLGSCAALSLLTRLERLSLESLSVNGAPLADLSCLAPLVGLKSLHLGHNAISRLDSLGGMTSLQGLHVSHNRVSSLASLTGLTSLQELDVSSNAIESLAPAGDLSTLQRLDASENPTIRELPRFWRLRDLRYLNISGTAIADLSPLWEARVGNGTTGQFSLKNLKSIDAWTNAPLENTDGFGKLDWVERIRLNPASLPGGRCPMYFESTCDFVAPGQTPR